MRKITTTHYHLELPGLSLNNEVIVKIITRQEFLALKGPVLFREVEAVQETGYMRWVPKAHTDPLMIRSGDSVDGEYYEAAVAGHSLSDFQLFSRDDHFASTDVDLDLTPIRGDKTNRYFLIYEKEDVATLIAELLNIYNNPLTQ